METKQSVIIGKDIHHIDLKIYTNQIVSIYDKSNQTWLHVGVDKDKNWIINHQVNQNVRVVEAKEFIESNFHKINPREPSQVTKKKKKDE